MKNHYFILCLLLISGLLTGCWDRVEIENRIFATAVAVDGNGAGEGDRYTLTVAVPTSAKDSGKDTAGGAGIKKASGATLTEALQKLDAQTGKKIYLGQAKMIVLDEAVCKEETLFRGVMDALDRHADIDRKVLVLAAKNGAAGILETQPPDESLPGLFVAAIYRQKSKAMGITFRRDFEKLCAELRATGSTMIPVVEAKDDTIKLAGALAIRDYQQAGSLDDTETRGYLWGQSGACEGSVLTVEADGVNVPLTVEKHKAKVSFYEAGERLRCLVEVRLTGQVGEHLFNDHFLNENSGREALARSYAESVADEITRTAGKMQLELRMDGYGWQDTLRKKQYTLYKKYAPDWTRAFSEMEIIPRVTVTILESESDTPL